MRTKLLLPVLISLMCLFGCSTVEKAPKNRTIAHDMNQPRPPVVTPGKTDSGPP